MKAPEGYILPVYPGGQNAMHRYLRENLHYPENERKQHIETIVLVTFQIDTTGNVHDILINNRESLPASFAEEAQRLVASMPRWKPGLQINNLARNSINFSITIPVEFLLDYCEGK